MEILRCLKKKKKKKQEQKEEEEEETEEKADSSSNAHLRPGKIITILIFLVIFGAIVWVLLF